MPTLGNTSLGWSQLAEHGGMHSHCSALLQASNLGVVVPQLPQHLDRMLPKHGRRSRDLRAVCQLIGAARAQ